MSDNNLQLALASPEVNVKFVAMYSATHGCPEAVAEQRMAVEMHQFMRILHETPSLSDGDYTDLSAKGVFLDVIGAGLSFDPVAKHVYVMKRSVNTKRKDAQGKDIYEKRLVFVPQANGLVHLAASAGSVKTVTQPVVVYEGDVFRSGTKEDGTEYIVHEQDLAGSSAKIIGAYCFVVEPDGTKNPVKITLRDIERLKEYSAKQNAKYDPALRKMVPGQPNELYSANGGQIDVGFLETKLIKKALKNKRKKPVNSAFYVEDTEVEEQEPVVHAQEAHQEHPATTAQQSTTVTEEPF